MLTYFSPHKRPRLFSSSSPSGSLSSSSSNPSLALSKPLISTVPECSTSPSVSCQNVLRLSKCRSTNKLPCSIPKAKLPARGKVRNVDVNRRQAVLRPQRVKDVRKPVKLEQMHLALSTAYISVTCKKCEMSYTRGAVEDEELHKSFCKRSAEGIEWPFLNHPTRRTVKTATFEVMQEGIQIGKGKGALIGSIWMMDGSVGGPLARKVGRITINPTMLSFRPGYCVLQ